MKKNIRGFTLPDLMVGIGIIAIIVVFGMELNVLVAKQQTAQQKKMQAIFLAASQIEDLKKYAVQYGITQSAFSEGNHTTSTMPKPEGYNLSYSAQNMTWYPVSPNFPFHYKEVTVTCKYNNDSNQVVIKGYVYQ